MGLNIGNILEWNNPDGTNKRSLSGNLSIDAQANYSRENSRFTAANELHYLFGLQREGLNNAARFQNTADNLATLHDVGLGIGKKGSLALNLIARTSTPVFTIYQGDYFRDASQRGKTRAFLSPYEATFSPGIRWQPGHQYLRISISPYSFNIIGVKNREVRSTGVYITESGADGQFKPFLFKRLGAEVNLWYDRQLGSWLNLQYRLGISSNYFEKIARNGLADGLFITRVKLVRDLYITHRFQLKGDMAEKPFRPYCSQNILLSFTRSF